MDQALSALIEDVYDRGLDEQVLIVAVRRVRPDAAGRARPTAASAATTGRTRMSRPGQRRRAADRAGGRRRRTARGEHPKDRPLTPQDLLATIYRHLGIDHRHEFKDLGGRPIPILGDGEPIRELV